MQTSYVGVGLVLVVHKPVLVKARRPLSRGRRKSAALVDTTLLWNYEAILMPD